MSTKRLATDAMFLTLALVVSYIEVLIPVPVGIPGVKLGLANGVIMVLLFFTTWTRTLEISVIRVVLAGFLFGNPMTIAYSLAGGILSLVIMGLLKKIEGFSPIGISVGGGVAHNIGQLSVACFLNGEYKDLLLCTSITDYRNDRRDHHRSVKWSAS